MIRNDAKNENDDDMITMITTQNKATNLISGCKSSTRIE